MKIINKHSSFNDIESYLNEYYSENDSTIILGYLLCTYDEILDLKLNSKNLIIFQLEQISNHLYDMNKDWLNMLFEADEIWDYDENNRISLVNEGLVPTRIVKFTYTATLNKIIHAEQKDIDVLFYGSLNEKRLQILNQLDQVCKLKIVTGAFASELDYYISKSKIILNIHYYNMDIQEQVRIFYLLCNGCCVISEFNTINNFGEFIYNVNRNEIISTVLNQLKNDNYKNQMNLVKTGWMKNVYNTVQI